MTRQALLTTLVCALPLLPMSAHGDGQSDCIRSFEHGQVLRKERHLQDAKKEFIRCSKQDCPAAVGAVCEKFLDEVENKIPTVLIAVSIDGEDARDARVDMDGAQLMTQIDVHEVAVEPGYHTFTITVPGFAPIERKVAVREGEKMKAIQVALTRPKPADSAGKRPEGEGGPDGGANGEVHRTLNIGPWIVVGAGGLVLAAATGFGIAAINQRDTACPGGGNICNEDEYNKGLTLADTSTALFLLGGAAVAGGLVWHFLDQSKGMSKPTTGLVEHPSRASVQPFLGVGAVGLRGTFE